MRKTGYILHILSLAVLIMFINSACKKVAAPGETKIDATGTLTLPAAAQGKSYVVIFDNDSDPFNGYSRKADGICPAGSAVSYSVSLGKAGNYYVYAYVEIDNAFSAADMKYAGAGDYFGIYGASSPASWPASANAVVNDAQGQVYDITLGTAAVNLTGTLTLSTSRNAPYYVILDTDSNYANGFVSIAAGNCAGSASVPYSMSALFPGTYYAYAFVDVDNDSAINYDPGDELGYYQAVTPLEPPPAAGLAIPGGGGPAAADIQLAVNNNNVSVLLKLPAAAAGKNYSVWFSDKLEMNAGSMGSAAFSGTCGAGANAFISGNVAAGSYYVFAYVDVSVTSAPNAGDYLGVYGAKYPQVPSSKTAAPGSFIIDLSQAANNVSGDVTGVGTLAGSTDSYVAVLTDLGDLNSVAGYYRGTCAGNFRYDLFVPFPGTYIVLGLVDVSGNMNFSAPGNKVGFAGNKAFLPYIPVTTPNITVNNDVNNEIDILVGEIPVI